MANPRAVGYDHIQRRRMLVEATEEALSKGVPVRTVVAGMSMAPTLRDGDHIIIDKAEALQVGDIVVAMTERKTGYVVHRIARVEGDMVVARGDNRETYDEPVPRCRVVGVVR